MHSSLPPMKFSDIPAIRRARHACGHWTTDARDTGRQCTAYGAET